MKKLALVLFLILTLVSVSSAGITMKTYTIAVGAAVTDPVTAEIDLPKPMLLHQMYVTIPNTDNNVTFTISITNASDVAVRSYAALAETTTHILTPLRDVGDGYKISATPSGATGNAVSLTVVVFYAD